MKELEADQTSYSENNATGEEKTYLEVSINRTSISVFYVFVFVCTFVYSDLSLLDISIYWRMQKFMFFHIL